MKSIAPHYRRGLEMVWMVTFAATICAAAGLLANVAPEWRWEHHPIHALVEGAGAFAAITVACFLAILLQFDAVPRRYVYVICALIAMGILDGFHAATHAGPLFIWLHSLAQFSGGMLFLGVIIPDRYTPRHAGSLITSVTVITCGVGGLSIVFPELVPAMQISGEFTLGARALNVIGGASFLLVAVSLTWDSWQVADTQRKLFASHCVLFGISGLIFDQSQLWDGAWWLWHGLRFLAYGLIFGLILHRLYEMQGALTRASTALEGEVNKKTRELQEEIALRRDKEEAYHGMAVLHEKRALDLERLQYARLERERAIRSTEELREVNSELDQFAYVASHDLKAPLRAIEKLASWIQEDAEAQLPEESKRHLNTLQQRILRMRALLDDLLAYSRAGRSKGVIVAVESARVVHDVVEFIDPPAGIQVEIDPALPVLNTYAVPFELVMRNLISNGIKHMGREDGQLKISAREDGDFIAFTVSDNGPGIPDAYREKIFVMFQTLAPRDVVEGTGMGLAIVRKILDSEGGRIIVVDSESGGAEFTFWWPRTSKPEEAKYGRRSDDTADRR